MATLLPPQSPQPLLLRRRSAHPAIQRRPAGKASPFRCSSLQTPNPAGVSVDDPLASSPPEAVLDDGELSSEDLKTLPPGACKTCGRNEIERGCNGEGRIQGGMATVPGFGWWPIKAYRPCPGFVASGGRYRRRGQSMDEVAFGRGERDASVGSSDKVRSSKKKP
ncbi:hypothetical protein Taro_013404 [Colocasia esculenta]|uniref:Uncharacterized protein n=1 Tax=Colocasia esculenta TaxID=4460 RepID=A0A843UGD3_COLES|nr:hypothetical protein [Colocasia esculenta]